MSSAIYIFLGPSLSINEAKEILPQAHYLKPVRCGDIIRLLRLNPSVIGIIDGYFENTAAVWHKEILLAISQGIKVIGGSSMGALRASELSIFGMEGVGEVASKFMSGEYIGDDEVALLHSDKEYISMTDSLVNIRATLKKIKLNDSLKTEIIRRAKALCYKERNLLDLIDKNHFPPEHHDELSHLAYWIEKQGVIDQKKEDALAVLKKISSLKDYEVANATENPNRTIFFRALQRNVMCRPFSHYYPWLPIQEKVALTSRVLISEYKLIRRFSYLLSICYDLACQKFDNKDIAKEYLFTDSPFNFYGSINAENWLEGYDHSLSSKNSLFNRVNLLNKLFFDGKSTDICNDEINKYIFILMKLSDDYCKYKSNSKNKAEILDSFKTISLQRFHLFKCVAVCWWFLENHFLEMGLYPTEDTFKENLSQLRKTKDLYTKELTQQWMTENDLDGNELCYIVEASSRLSHIVLQNNTDSLGVLGESNTTWWFLDALCISGYYIKAKELFLNKVDNKRLKKHILVKSKSIEKYAKDFDFVGGEQDFNTFLECLSSS